MRIGVVCYPTYGGSGVVATELGKAMAKFSGHTIHFITHDLPRRLDYVSENIHFHKVSVNDYPLFKYPPYEIALAGKIVEVVKKEKLDLLHVHYAVPHASAAYMAKQILKTEGINLPVVTTLHGTDITLVGNDETYASVVSFSINESDAVTSVSESLKNDTFEILNIQNEIDVVYNFIDLERFHKKNKDYFKKAICTKGEKLLVHTSNFREVKRVDDVVKIFWEVRKKIPAKLLLAGDGPERLRIEKMVDSMACFAEDIRFVGEIGEVEELLSIADVFLMPSEKESFGLAALEAMACHVPVISSNTGGLPELVQQGKSGFMSNIGDIEDMAKNALYILDEHHLPTFKKNAQLRAEDFEIRKILPQYESVYLKAIERSKNKA